MLESSRPRQSRSCWATPAPRLHLRESRERWGLGVFSFPIWLFCSSPLPGSLLWIDLFFSTGFSFFLIFWRFLSAVVKCKAWGTRAGPFLLSSAHGAPIPVFFSGQVLVEATPGCILHPPGALPWCLVRCFFFFFRGRKPQKITKSRATTSALTISCRPRQTKPAANTTPVRLGCTRADPGASSSFPSPPGGHGAASGHLLGAGQRLGRTDPA